MFSQKRNTVSVLKRKLIAMMFLGIFMCAGASLSGFSQVEINKSNKRQTSVQVDLDEEFEEDLPELLEPIEIIKPPKHYY